MYVGILGYWFTSLIAVLTHILLRIIYIGEFWKFFILLKKIM